MTCPYCESKMHAGTIETGNTLSWSPSGEKNPKLSKFSSSEHSIIISKAGLTKWACADASYCPVCKKIIISLE